MILALAGQLSGGGDTKHIQGILNVFTLLVLLGKPRGCANQASSEAGWNNCKVKLTQPGNAAVAAEAPTPESKPANFPFYSWLQVLLFLKDQAMELLIQIFEVFLKI